MVSGVTNVNGFAPTSRPRQPQEILQDINAARFENRYKVLSDKQKSGSLSDVEAMELYLMKAKRIADKISENPPVIY